MTIAKHGKKKVNSPMSVVVALFVIGLGFVSAALIYTANHIIRGQPAQLIIDSTDLFKIMGAFFFCMLVGPYLTAERGMTFWRQGRISSAIFGLCGMISLLWSFCAGVFVAQLLIAVGFIHA